MGGINPPKVVVFNSPQISRFITNAIALLHLSNVELEEIIISDGKTDELKKVSEKLHLCEASMLDAESEIVDFLNSDITESSLEDYNSPILLHHATSSSWKHMIDLLVEGGVKNSMSVILAQVRSADVDIKSLMLKLKTLNSLNENVSELMESSFEKNPKLEYARAFNSVARLQDSYLALSLILSQNINQNDCSFAEKKLVSA